MTWLRVSVFGLEDHALFSAGAYGVLKDMSILRGAKNDEYWQSLREGHDPKTQTLLLYGINL